MVRAGSWCACWWGCRSSVPLHVGGGGVVGQADARGVGNTFGSAEAFAQLIDEVETKIFGTLPDSTWFYPGHGGDSTLGAERGSLPEWRARGW
jgi:glyoxylase-like metal-dependent hydrolase (beta-lactamase superfamily II)